MARDARFLPQQLLLAVVLLLTWWIYQPGLAGPFLLDDVVNLGYLQGLESGDTSIAEATFSRQRVLGRQLSHLSFAIEGALHGGNAAALKATNLKLHLVCGLLVTLLVARLLTQALPGQPAGYTLWLAVWAGSLWLLAPMFVSTVLYIVQRMTQLSALFVLVGLLLYTYARPLLNHRPTLAWSLLGVVFVLCWPLAIFSKENGALLFFLAAQLLESSVIPLELYFEHRNYLPAVGVFLALALLLNMALRMARLKRLLLFAMLCMPLVFLIGTAARVQHWSSWQTLLDAASVTHPDSPRVQFGLANAWSNQGDLARALAANQRASALYLGGRNGSGPLLQRLSLYCRAGDDVPAMLMDALRARHRFDNDVLTVNAIHWLTQAKQLGGCSRRDVTAIGTVLLQLTFSSADAGPTGMRRARQQALADWFTLTDAPCIADVLRFVGTRNTFPALTPAAIRHCGATGRLLK